MKNNQKKRKNNDNNKTLSKEYILTKEAKNYKILITKNDKEILISHLNYKKTFSLESLSTLVNKKFQTLESAYKYISHIFESNNAFIKNIFLNKEMHLFLNITNKKQTEIILKFICNNSIKLGNPSYLEPLSVLVNDINKKSKFIIFKSINNILYLLYYNLNNSIICFDLTQEKVICEIKNYIKGEENIINIKHFFDCQNKTDIISIIYEKENILKLLNTNNWECICTIDKIYKYGYLNSVCILNKNNENYIITSNFNFDEQKSEEIKVFDFKGNIIKKINNSKNNILLMDSYSDKNNNYLIICTENNLKSYDFNNNKVYHNYCNNKKHNTFLILKNQDMVKLIDHCGLFNIQVFNFHTCELLIKINLSIGSDTEFCLWNNKYLFVTQQEDYSRTMKLINITSGKLVKKINTLNKFLSSMKKINHSKKGECLIIKNNYSLDIWGFNK